MDEETEVYTIYQRVTQIEKRHVTAPKGLTFNTAIYRYERFDPAVNKELWRRIPGWKLRFTWLKAWLEHDKAARIGYKAWLYARVSSGGEWLTGDMLDWNQEIVK